MKLQGIIFLFLVLVLQATSAEERDIFFDDSRKAWSAEEEVFYYSHGQGYLLLRIVAILMEGNENIRQSSSFQVCRDQQLREIKFALNAYSRGDLFEIFGPGSNNLFDNIFKGANKKWGGIRAVLSDSWLGGEIELNKEDLFIEIPYYNRGKSCNKSDTKKLVLFLNNVLKERQEKLRSKSIVGQGELIVPEPSDE